jgi:hypothetical protein
MCENVLNVVKVTYGLWVLLAIHYIAITVVEDIGICDCGNINIYPLN